ncbi:hypothetical protein BTS2_0206 [Bacillus sp. TS-2]|nr:hypothetical protein BTS2_0206 [Bacillus sp. TS-2]
MKIKNYFTIGVTLLFIFVLFTLMVKNVDVQPIGPEKSLVGFATINNRLLEVLSVNWLWYQITDWLSLIVIMVALGFAILGARQMLIRKSIKKVDKDIMVLGAFYISVVICYVFFELYIINYRPVILYSTLEASYPSTHTMMVLCIMTTAIMQFHTRIKNQTFRNLFNATAILIMTITILGRLISGVHWFTDIIAGILLSLSLITFYYAAIKKLESSRNKGILNDCSYIAQREKNKA